MHSILRKNASGIIIRVQIVESGTDMPVDVSLAATKQIRFTKPDGTTVTKTATFTTNGVDGKIEYAVEVAFLDQSGFWTYEGFIAFAAGFSGPTSETEYFEVRD
jgi:hypothetical protein